MTESGRGRRVNRQREKGEECWVDRERKGQIEEGERDFGRMRGREWKGKGVG